MSSIINFFLKEIKKKTTGSEDKLYHSVYVLEPFMLSKYNSDTQLCPFFEHQIELKFQ